MPAGKPDLRQTSPRQPLSTTRTTARQRLIAPHHDTPSIGIPHPCATAVFWHRQVI